MYSYLTRSVDRPGAGFNGACLHQAPRSHSLYDSGSAARRHGERGCRHSALPRIHEIPELRERADWTLHTPEADGRVSTHARPTFELDIDSVGSAKEQREVLLLNVLPVMDGQQETWREMPAAILARVCRACDVRCTLTSSLRYGRTRDFSDVSKP
ncbi:hypothetical protein K466DRAFT_212427 [Polyporus arcularius HHB13444]|uniref:Uncharacterized protein n=1 Tax=Polyporus arcularius HHB13444 TaxID=1314778 RepID=A0A5C3PVA5_9APHY|nr:hypothetical protein K466DRAFT_212427 [Polyporus arcularius HHB13444]